MAFAGWRFRDSRCRSDVDEAGMAIAITCTVHDAAGLRRAASCSKDANAARRMLARALVREGRSRAEAAQSCGTARQTLRDWVHRFNQKGLAGLSDRKPPGAKTSRHLIPEFDGAIFSREWKEALWDRFCTGAPARRRQCVERYNRVREPASAVEALRDQPQDRRDVEEADITIRSEDGAERAAVDGAFDRR